MIAMICVDDGNGTMFNNRRQSQDRVLCGRVMDISRSGRLWVTPYSSSLFNKDNVSVSARCLELCGENEFCFVEGLDLARFEGRIRKLIVFRWNRAYPSDEKLTIDLKRRWRLVNTREFIGSSHPKITEETYERL